MLPLVRSFGVLLLKGTPVAVGGSRVSVCSWVQFVCLPSGLWGGAQLVEFLSYISDWLVFFLFLLPG